MSTVSDTDPAALNMHRAQSTASACTRPFHWSLRRELWEYRSIYIAPLVVAGLVLFGFLIRLARLPQIVHAAATMPWWKQYLQLALPFAIATMSVLITGAIVAVFYCLGALNNERRDRSILFWKSLPVSDLTAVISKACIPFFVLPVVVLMIALVTQLLMLLVGSAVLLGGGSGVAALWSHWPIGQMSLVLIYIVIVGTLWYAPIYGWLLMVSAWARRMTFLWAVLVPIGLSVVEKIALDTSYVGSLVQYRLKGFLSEAFASPRHDVHTFDPVALLTPAKFFSSPGLWLGLVVAVVFLAAAVWLRRDREPI
jgi:ABC-2 type transport system permease protein